MYPVRAYVQWMDPKLDEQIFRTGPTRRADVKSRSSIVDTVAVAAIPLLTLLILAF